MLQDSFSEQPDLPTSLLYFIFFTGYLLHRGSNTNCPCFALRSFLIRLPSTFQNFFTFTLLPSSSALLQTPKCSEYNPSEQSPVVRALSLARLQLSGTNSLFMSTILLLSALLNLPWNLSLFSLVSLPWYATGVCVSMHMHANLCVRVHVCVHSCCMYWILTICICKECVRA